MERSSFLERIIPGLKDFRDSRDLSKSFGENPPEEVLTEIRRLNRRISLKVITAMAITTTAALGLVLNRRSEETKKLDVYEAIFQDISANFNSQNMELIRIKGEEKVQADGTIIPHSIDEKNDELGLNFGFLETKKTINVPGIDEPINFEIDRSKATMEPRIGDASAGKTFSLEKNIFIGQEYLEATKVTSLRIIVPFTYVYNGKFYSSSYGINFKLNILPIKEELKIEDEISAQAKLNHPTIIPSTTELKNAGVIVDKEDNVIQNPSQIDSDLTMEMGDKVLFFGAPKIHRGKTNGHDFEILETLGLVFKDKDGKVIEDSHFNNGALFSKTHLEKRGVKDIVVVLNVRVNIKGDKVIRPSEYKYTLDDFAYLNHEIIIEYPSGRKLTIKP